jgi:hypothetical protein
MQLAGFRPDSLQGYTTLDREVDHVYIHMIDYI